MKKFEVVEMSQLNVGDRFYFFRDGKKIVREVVKKIQTRMSIKIVGVGVVKEIKYVSEATGAIKMVVFLTSNQDRLSAE